MRQSATVKRSESDEEIGLVGNLLLDRMVGAKILTVSTAQYAQYGSQHLTSQLAEQLHDAGRNPYVIPLGGSCARGSFGYMECVREILDTGVFFDHIVFGCGSGGTAAGTAFLESKRTQPLYVIVICLNF